MARASTAIAEARKFLKPAIRSTMTGENAMKKLSLAILALLVPLAAGAEFRIAMKGGVSYLTETRPALKHGAYVFKTLQGTLMSVRKRDVVSVEANVKIEKTESARPIGRISEIPSGGGGSSSIASAAAPEPAKPGIIGAPAKGDMSTDAFQPGIGLAPPSAPGDYQVGKTIAAPASGTVESGSAPMLETPPPPPPPQ
jgi:hypothetical protein